jgi:predicted ferric reductase
MGCGYECTGSITGPIDRVTLAATYLFGYGLWLFWGLALVSLIVEITYEKWRKRGTAA